MTHEHDDEINDDWILRYTQRKRREFVEEITNDGFPVERGDQAVMLTALSDMDRAALGNKRIGANERLAAADALVAQAINTLSNRFGSENPFEGGGGQSSSATPDVGRLPEANAVPGETDIGISNETFETLVAKFEND